ncbi:phosphoglycerate dehydrogenase [bacterium]|jgi:phosphoglycerate dehydrogenase-like enzyme|nr:phosphoglycerate dehydrogenase [bacterium]
MNSLNKIAVCSRSFSRNKMLRRELSKKYNNVKYNDSGLSLSDGLLVEFLQGSSHAIIALEKIDDNILSQLPELKVISKYGVGLDMINMKSMQKYGIRLGWSEGVNRRSVSELVISLSIALLRHIPESNKKILSGIWEQHIGRQLSGKNFGIIGCGSVGKDLVELLQPFKCKILVNDIKRYDVFYKKYDLNVVGKKELLLKSDVVTLHTPLDNSTKNMLSASMLKLMKPSSVLINIARGGLINEIALKKMLMDGRLAAAALDVFEIEPPQDKELLNLSNFLATPHIGGSSQEAILSMGMAAINGLEDNKKVDIIHS